MAATDTAAVAKLVVDATVTAAEEYAVKAGAGSAGDLFGVEGIEPVLSAALAAASADAAPAMPKSMACQYAASEAGVRQSTIPNGKPTRSQERHPSEDSL